MPSFTQRTVVLSLFGLLIAGVCVAIVDALLAPIPDSAGLLTMISGLIIDLLLLGLYWRGWEPARYVYLVFITVLVGTAPQVTQELWFYVALPPAIGAVFASPAWILGTAILGYTIILVRSGGQGPSAAVASVVFLSLVVGAISLGQWLTGLARRSAEQNAQQAQEAQARAEAHAAHLAVANEQLAAQSAQQRRLLELVATLETPTVQLADRLFLAPLVGHLDNDRMQALMTRLLETAHTQRATVIILDLAGVPELDLASGHALLEVVQALRLLGCTVVLSGMSSASALTLSQEDWSATQVMTVRSPQEALERYHVLG